MNNFILEFFDFFLPRICPACGNRLLPDEKCICALCFGNILFADEERLRHEFNRKFKNDKIISGFTSLFVFEKDKELQHLIHSVKYRQRFHNAAFLGKTMGVYLADQFNEWNIDLIIPVPLHIVKKTERGYNQSFYISKGLSDTASLSMAASVIKRIKYTQSQTTMNLDERKENIRNAFKVTSAGKIKDKNILLVDDVITTGATTTECAAVLLSSGAKRIYAASAAIAD